MDSIELLNADHDKVKALFERFRTAHEQGDDATMQEVVAKVVQELELHTTLEEELVYPRIREADESLVEDVAEAIEEHHVVEILMNELCELGRPSEEWVAKMQVLMENVEHHVEEEEGDLFPQVREVMDESVLVELGEQLLARKQALQASAGDATRDELYQRAKELGIEGRSSMTKKELADAVAGAGA
jgi:hemerythrin superfamily protein